MFASKKILPLSITLLFLTGLSVCGHAQSKEKEIKKKEKQPITVGFQGGRELLFNSTPLLHSKQSKVHYGISKSLVLRKPLAPHFKLEAGFGYSAMPTTGNLFLPNKNNNLKQSTFSLPITIQYYLLPEKCRLRPFCGAGLKYNIFDNKNNIAGGTPGTEIAPQYNNPESDTKYITILFTQGVTFEVNTKIEICQSFHFIPQANNNILGIDLGIGFKIQ